MLPSIEQIKERIERAVPGAKLEILPNDSPAAQPSLIMNREAALEIARFLRDDPEFSKRDGVYFYLADSLARTDRKAEALPHRPISNHRPALPMRSHSATPRWIAASSRPESSIA